MRARVEVFAAIRRDARVEGLSIRALAVRYGVHRRTVRAALDSARPPERRTPVRMSTKLEAFKPAIDVMLLEDTTAPWKQRHTARRVLARLIEEHGAMELSYSTMRDYVRGRRAEIDVEAGRRVEAAFRLEHDRFPIYDPVRRSGEKTLAVWVGRQRAWSGKGVLRPDRWEQLGEVLPGWDVEINSL